MKTAVVGASSDRSRFSNKCIRAYHQQGWTVFPVNPKESEILGLRCYPSLADISGKIDVVIGNNEWTNGIFERAGYPVLRLGFYKRYLYEGVRIRRLIKIGKRWENRVPDYIVTLLHGWPEQCSFFMAFEPLNHVTM